MSQQRPPLIPPRTAPDASASLSPSDHVRMLVELLRPATPELARRWLAALLAVPEIERAGVVDAVERQIIATYEHANPESDRSGGIDVVHPPVAREGFVEQVVVTYAAAPESTANSAAGQRPTKRRAQPRAR